MPGVPLTGPIVTRPAGNYPTHSDQLGLGGWRPVANTTARNAIPVYLREEGMAVRTLADGKVWILTAYPGAGTNADWTEFSGGGGGGGATYAVARFLVGPDSDIVVANDVANWVPLIGSGTLAGAFVASKTGDGPVGAALILDLKLSTDGGSTFTSLWHATPSNRPTIADGAVVGSAGAPDTTAYTNGNLVRLDVVQVGSTTPGKNVTVALF